MIFGLMQREDLQHALPELLGSQTSLRLGYSAPTDPQGTQGSFAWSDCLLPIERSWSCSSYLVDLHAMRRQLKLLKNPQNTVARSTD